MLVSIVLETGIYEALFRPKNIYRILNISIFLDVDVTLCKFHRIT